MTMHPRLLGLLVGLVILGVGTGLAAVDSVRHREGLQAEASRQVAAHADDLASQLTRLSRESRTVAARLGDDFPALTRDVVVRNPSVLGSMVVEGPTLRVTDHLLPGLPPALAALVPISEGLELAGDGISPTVDAALQAVVERGELRVVGPIDLVGRQLALLADQAPPNPANDERRVLILILDVDRILAGFDDLAGAEEAPLELGVMLDSGIDEETSDLAPVIVRGSPSLWDDGVVARAEVAGAALQVAGRPVDGWPISSPATPFILLPTLMGAALAHLTVVRRQGEQARLRDRVEAATADLRQARAREKATIDHSPDGLLDVLDGTVTAVNPAGTHLLRRPASQVVGRRLDELLGSPAPSADPGSSIEVSIDDRVVLVRSSPSLGGDGATRQVVVLHDVTRERASQALLLRYTERLEDVNDQLDEVEKVRSDLVAKVSHEIRTPLTVIRGVAEMLRQPQDDDEVRGQLLAALDRQVERLTDQVHGLLELAEATDDDSETTDPVDLDLAVVARTVSATLGATCEVEGAAPVRLVPEHAHRMLRALLTNAVKYGRAPIRAVAASDDTTSWIDVCDDGPGVHLEGEDPFAPFVQGTVGDRRTSVGLGVGLAVARRLARDGGGDVRLIRAEGPTTFRIELPRATVPAPPHAPAAPASGVAG